MRAGWVLAAALVACSPPGRGVLEPVGGAGVTLVESHGIPDDTARLVEGGVTADVVGDWSARGESIEITYRASGSPASLAIASSSTWRDQAVPASAAWDRSGSHAGNVMGEPLLARGRLALAAGRTTVVQVEYDRPAGAARPAAGAELTITVPMPHGAQPVRFRLGAE